MQAVNGNASISTIDHFACSYGLINNICEAGVVHRGDNPSNHSAIYAKINVGDYNSTSEAIIFPKRINWEASTEQARSAFNTVLTENLNNLELPAAAQCVDLHCTEHSHQLEEYTVEILEAIEAASEETLVYSCLLYTSDAADE